MQDQPLTPHGIKLEVAREFDIDPYEFYSKSRARRRVDAKHEAIARIHEAYRELSLKDIARHFGGMDHSSVLNALKRLKAGRYAGETPRQRMKPQPILTRTLARRLYFREGHSISRIRKDFRTSDEVVRKFFRLAEIKAGQHPPKPKPGTPPTRQVPPHVIASTYHQIDFKRAGHSAQWYRANCEIPPELDAAELRALRRQPRLIPERHEHGSWMGSPAALCASAP